MPRLSEEFAGNYLKAEDLGGKEVTVRIRDVEIKMFSGDKGDEKKVVLLLQGTDRCVVCNKTNRETVRDLYGDDTDDWIGKRIVLYPSRVEFGGKRVWAIRIQEYNPDEPRMGAPPAAVPAVAPAAVAQPTQFSPMRPPVHESAISSDPDIPF
jgi:hypothetical protein